jgi:hypothetical protein
MTTPTPTHTITSKNPDAELIITATDPVTVISVQNYQIREYNTTDPAERLQDIWVRRDDGYEYKIVLPTDSLDTRAGHKLRIIQAHTPTDPTTRHTIATKSISNGQHTRHMTTRQLVTKTKPGFLGLRNLGLTPGGGQIVATIALTVVIIAIIQTFIPAYQLGSGYVLFTLIGPFITPIPVALIRHLNYKKLDKNITTAINNL